MLRTLLSVPLRLKIIVPYLVVATLLAGLASYQVARSFVDTLEERFRGQLEDASYRVAEELVTVEEEHLSSVRSIAFTLGMPEAMLSHDISTTKNLALPQVVNDQLYLVDLLDSQGLLLASWHRTGEALEYIDGQNTNYLDWASVRAVVNGQVDEVGDKYSEIVEAPWGLSLYTAGPVLIDGEVVGVVLVGSPLSEVAPELAVNSLANVTIYNSAGIALISTLGETDQLIGMNQEAYEQLNTPSDYAYTRNIDVGSRRYVEAVDNLYLRAEPSGWFYGVALPESLVTNLGGTTVVPLLVIFIAGILILVALGIAVAQLIAIPVFRLLGASEQVGGGDFSVQVDIYADDEIGLLTQGFNHMVDELRQREFVREMFGRMVSKDVSEAVLMGNLAIGGEARSVTVLFTDVRGFTSLAEKFSPDEVIKLLNQFFGIITNATRKYHGVINHFGGDSVLAVFGAPIERSQKDSLTLALLAAIEIRKGILELNAERFATALEPLRYGVGINSGKVIAGNIGTEDRFHYTVIGDVVNVAARLQGISRQFPRTPLLIPEKSLDLIRNDKLFEFQYLGDFRLKGKEKPVSTYAVVGINALYPESFSAFDAFPYPKAEALLGCALFCKGYSINVIADTLQINDTVIQRWIEIASEHIEDVAPVLKEQFDLSAENLAKLSIDNIAQGKESEN